MSHLQLIVTRLTGLRRRGDGESPVTPAVRQRAKEGGVTPALLAKGWRANQILLLRAALRCTNTELSACSDAAEEDAEGEAEGEGEAPTETPDAVASRRALHGDEEAQAYKRARHSSG